MKKIIETPHINAKKTDFAKTVLMPGDPLRSKYIAEKFLTDAKLGNNIRGIQGWTGYYKGKKISVMAHGMGMPCASIYAHELYNFYDVQNIIRIGTCGGLTKDTHVKDVVIAPWAITPSNIGKRLGNCKKKVYGDPKLVSIATKIANNLVEGVDIGGALTSDVFYGQDKLVKKAPKGCVAIEMETYAIYAVARYSNKRALSLLTVSDNSITGEPDATAKERETTFNDMVTIALETAIKL